MPRIFSLEIQPEELPIAAVGMERVPESPTQSKVPVDYSDQEVNPELTKVTHVMDICRFLRCGRKIKLPQIPTITKVTSNRSNSCYGHL
ncbi:hypothetical protein TNIN_269821 [Trichonephila inaurata madagascariensis]|uniref:Uncharacterized protein n=1 Tax=Trichonephila inaurata madagascariensis TaxID=2747483 RepID=A0A8X6X4R6_9ARAC|nr:hypothetical protein TNIN_269821 [Trichonephila inaurata madagascariensis]